MRQHQLEVVFNEVYTAGMEALAHKWGISPAAVARRGVRKLLRENDLYHQPQRSPSQSRQHATPTMVHRTLRLTPTLAGMIDGIADLCQLTRSKTVRALVTHASHQPVTYQQLSSTRSRRRTVRWSVRLDTQQNNAIVKVSKLLRCSQTDAAAALLASAAAQRNLLQQLTQHPRDTS